MFEFLSEVFGEALAEKVGPAVTSGIFGGEVRSLRAALVFPELCVAFAQGASPRAAVRRLRQRRGALVKLRGGNELLCQMLAQKLEAVLVRSAAQELSYDPGRKEFSLRTIGRAPQRHSAVVVATSGERSAVYLAALDAKLAREIANLSYAAIAVVHAAAQRSDCIPERGFGVLFPPGAHDDLLGVLFNSQIFPHSAPKGSELLTFCFGGAGRALGSAAHYEERAAAVAREILNMPNIRILAQQQWTQAIPQYDSQAVEALTAIRTLEQRFPGLHFIGSECGGVGVPSRIKVAVSAAKQIADEFAVL